MTKTRPRTTHSRVSTFRLGDAIDHAMDQLQERDGIPPSEQARRALTAFLTDKGFPPAGTSTQASRTRKGNR